MKLFHYYPTRTVNINVNNLTGSGRRKRAEFGATELPVLLSTTS